MITEEMINEFKAAWYRADGKGEEGNRVRSGLEAVESLIWRGLLDFAWDGRARGSILGAIEQAEDAREAPPLGYRAKH